MKVSMCPYLYTSVVVWVCLTSVYIQLSPGHGVVEGQVKQAETLDITSFGVCVGVHSHCVLVCECQ